MRTVSVSMVLLLGSMVALAQSAAPSSNSRASERTTFKSQSDLVLVPVVVTDSKGAHVTGLKREDFLVKDNGHSRDLTVFEEVIKSGAKTKPLVFHGGYTNLNAPKDVGKQACIVVLDTINTPTMLKENARAQLLKFLEQAAMQGQPLAILLLTPHGIVQVSSFRTAPEELAKALRTLHMGTQLVDALGPDDHLIGNDLAMSRLDPIMAASKAIYARDRARLTMAGLQQIATAYSGMPGRKVMIWATVGLPLAINDPRSFEGQDLSTITLYEDTMRTLARTNMAIYPINVEGLIGIPELTASQSRAKISEIETLDQKVDKHVGMEMLAEATGGRAFFNSNDLAGLFKRAVDDSLSYYILGFTLNSEKRNLGWHKLKVQTSDAKLHTLARTGYYMGAAQNKTDTPLAEAKTSLRDAVESPVELADMRINVQLTGDTTEQKDGKPVHVQMFNVNLEPGDFAVDTANKNLVDLTLSAVTLDGKKKVISENTKQVRTTMAASALARMNVAGLSLHDKVEAPPEAKELRFTVRDNQNGKVGTVAIAVGRAKRQDGEEIRTAR